ncbi:hypothetical protein BO82DRAFT_114457 [Aspergillus uvarum CBS 121591]|uniref:Uncharacterized protein n=1 Tax=Aspergillus uvarum CBS 121591 TaxID=1448315 RepID=A0A319C2E8_9EURO|nr:hypothetical protein BO82DRAFT_114457 [Aspergillus uvarum CBS 121591]PYH80176.1 hypothetical protein BO82DRAFT_114457 [Aspergillus uvarum CBS 121591]
MANGVNGRAFNCHTPATKRGGDQPQPPARAEKRWGFNRYCTPADWRDSAGVAETGRVWPGLVCRITPRPTSLDGGRTGVLYGWNSVGRSLPTRELYFSAVPVHSPLHHLNLQCKCIILSYPVPSLHPTSTVLHLALNKYLGIFLLAPPGTVIQQSDHSPLTCDQITFRILSLPHHPSSPPTLRFPNHHPASGPWVEFQLRPIFPPPLWDLFRSFIPLLTPLLPSGLDYIPHPLLASFFFLPFFYSLGLFFNSSLS